MTETPIPFARPSFRETDLEGLARVMRSGWLTTGDESARLETELSEYLGGSHVAAVSSCTAALEISLSYLELPAGSRVGVPTWTFVSTALAAVHVGLQPVLLDVEERTLNVDPQAVRAALVDGLDALVPVHFGGVPVSTEVYEACRDAGVPVVEDAAHAIGATDRRGRVAGQGNVGACFSFYANKNLSSGEGGAIATDDPDLAAFATSYRLHGLDRDAWARYRPDSAVVQYDLLGPGIKANLPDVLATLARAQLARFDELQACRRRLIDRYRARLATWPDIAMVPPEPVEGSADHLAVVLLPERVDRDAVRSELAAVGVGTSVHFRPLHDFGWFREAKIPIGPTGVETAERLRSRVLSLPLYPDLSEAEVDRVCEALGEAL